VVRRLVPGETVTLADGRGSGVTGTVAAVTKTVVTVAVEAVVRLPAPRLWITVAQALPKPDRAELALDLMTEVGVDEIVPWAAARSQVRWTGERGEKAQAKWQSVLREASKQSRRLRFPVLGSCASLAELVTRAGTVDCAIIMHERATTPIAACPVPAAGSVLIVIGPEGGLTDDEVTALTAAGGRAYLMGDTVLRTSTAGAVAVTQVRLLTGRGGTLG
jgi:16S rRNA (uracil1498-N3)-methyltransferase